MGALSADFLADLLEALRIHRNARRAAETVGVSPATAWRVARKHGITLISLADHMKARRADPDFVAKQAPAARKAVSLWLKSKHADPRFRKKIAEAARRNLTKLNRDPAFREASSERLKRLHEDPHFRGKQAAAAASAAHRRARVRRHKDAIVAALHDLAHPKSDAAHLHGSGDNAKQASDTRPPRNRGFAIAPVLYLLGLIGAGALFGTLWTDMAGARSVDRHDYQDPLQPRVWLTAHTYHLPFLAGMDDALREPGAFH